MIKVIENQTLLDISIQQTGSVLAAFDYAIKNELSLSTSLIPGQLIFPVEAKEYERFEFEEIVKKYIDARDKKVIVTKYQSLLDIAIQEDGCVLAAFDWAVNNKISLTDYLIPGQKLKMPKSEEFRYNDLANYFSGKGIRIATQTTDFTINYELPGDFPFSF